VSGGTFDASSALRAAGIPHPREAPTAVRVECTRLARQLDEHGVRSVGLLPATPEVAIPALSLVLAAGLAEQRGPVGVLDATGSWPCAEEIRRKAPPPGGRPVATAWVADRVELLTVLGEGPLLEQLRDVVASAGSRYAYLVVDLAGLEDRGEHFDVCDLLDGVAVVARSGRTTLRQATACLRELPPGRGLGVLLTGTRSLDPSSAP
jgi:hypothetical protein